MTAIIDGTNGVTTPNVLTSSSGVALTLQSSGTTAVTIDTSQNVLVGTTSLYGGEKLAMLQSTNNRGFVIQQTNASNTSPPFLIDASRNTTNNTYNAIAYYNSGAGAYKFQVADSGSIATAGSVALGSSTPPTSGIGIQFPATQSASSNANTLDDYEEGTWTPTWNGGSVTTFDSIYIRIGRFVLIQLDITLGSSSSTAGSLISLPFPPTQTYAPGSMGYTTYASTVVNVEAQATPGIAFRSGNGSTLQCNSVASNRFIFSISYVAN